MEYTSNKFWNFEKTAISNFLADRPSIDIWKFLDDKDLETIKRDLKYGTIEYLDDSVLFVPSRENASTIRLNLFLGNDHPEKLLKKFLSSFRKPFNIFVDFWCIGHSSLKGNLVIYPSMGTSINKNRLIKTDKDLDDLMQIVGSDNLEEKIFQVKPLGATMGYCLF